MGGNQGVGDLRCLSVCVFSAVIDDNSTDSDSCAQSPNKQKQTNILQRTNPDPDLMMTLSPSPITVLYISPNTITKRIRITYL